MKFGVPSKSLTIGQRERRIQNSADLDFGLPRHRLNEPRQPGPRIKADEKGKAGVPGVGRKQKTSYAPKSFFHINPGFHLLHLLRLNLVIYAAALCASFAALVAAGIPLQHSFTLAATVSTVLNIISLAVIFFAWKWIPGFPLIVFPDISGNWKGAIAFRREGQENHLSAALNVQQNVNAISLILETDDAESETIAVYPRRLSNKRFEILYVYETRRKEGRPPPFYRYRGTAVMRLQEDRNLLVGSYYTEQGGQGTVSFTRA